MRTAAKNIRKATGQTGKREEVARRAKVSVATVSMSLRDDPRIKESTRELVQMVARELNYRPRASARALAGGRAHSIGTVFSHPHFEDRVMIGVYSLALQSISEALAKRNYYMSLSARSIVEDDQGEQALPRMFHETGIDGFILIQKPGQKLAEALRSQGEPFVVFDGERIPGGHSVCVDECRAAELAVEHLVGLGHRRIANMSTLPARVQTPRLGEVPSHHSHRSADYPKGYLRAMATASLPAIPGWDEQVTLFEHLEATWQLPQKPTALLVYDDQCAAHAVRWLAERGISVPDQVSVIALHDIGIPEMHAFYPTGITCAANMQSEMASVAVDLLLRSIEHPEKNNGLETTLIEPRLVVRQSTGPCP